MNKSNVTPIVSKCKKLGRGIATKNHNLMYLLTSIAIPGLFIVNTCFNGITGWYQGGIFLLLGYVFLDLCMGYFWCEMTGHNTGYRKFACAVGFVLTVSCSVISLIACVSMFDAQRSVDYTQASVLENQTKALQSTVGLFDQVKNPDNYARGVQQLRESIIAEGNAKVEAVRALGYAPEHAAFQSDGSIFKKWGWSLQDVRVWMCACILLSALLGMAVYRKEDMVDDVDEPANDTHHEKPRVRVFNQGDGAVSI